MRSEPPRVVSTPLHLSPRFRRAWLPLGTAVVASIVLLLVQSGAVGSAGR